MFISSKLFVWHLSRRIVRIEGAGKWAAIYRKKPSRDWLEKDQWESVISVQPLGCTRILFVGRGRGLKFWCKNSCTAQRLYTNDAFSLVLFQPITARLFPINSRSFSCALYSDDSSWQVSDEKLRRYEHFNRGNSQVLYHQPTLELCIRFWERKVVESSNVM